MSTDPRLIAWTSLHDPATPASDLAAIAAAHPEFASAVAQHPNAYPELVVWARSQAAASAPVARAAYAQAPAIPAYAQAAVAPPHSPAADSYASPSAAARTVLSKGRRWWIVFGALYVAAALFRAVPGELIYQATYRSGATVAFVSFVCVIAWGAVAVVAAALSAPTPGRRIGGILTASGAVLVTLLFNVPAFITGMGWGWMFFHAPIPAAAGIAELIQSLLVVGLLFAAWGLTWPVRGAGWVGIASVPVAVLVAFAFSWGYSSLAFSISALVGLVIVAGGVYGSLALTMVAERRLSSLAPRAPGVSQTAVSDSSRTNTMAIAALVCGFLVSLLAVIFGHIALSQIRRTGEAGRGFAIAGLVLGYVGLGLGLLSILIYGAVWTTVLSGYGY